MLFLTAHTNEILAFLTISIILFSAGVYYGAYRLCKKYIKNKKLVYIIPLLVVIALLIIIPFTREFISYFLFNRVNIRIPSKLIF